MASVRHLDGDRYLVRVTDGVGWQASKTIRATSQRAAERAAEKIIPELRARTAKRKREHAASTDPAALTLERLTDQWIAAKRAEGRSSTTIAQYESSAQWWRGTVLGSRIAADLEVTEIDAWLSGLRRADGGKLAASTVQQIVGDMAMALRFGSRKHPRDFPARPITDAVTLPGHRTKRRTVPDEHTLREAVPAMLAQGSIGIAGALALGLGVRQGEACGLRWTDRQNGRVVIRRSTKRSGEVEGPKSDAGRREVPISEVARLAFDAAEAWHAGTVLEGSPWVLPSSRSLGAPMLPGSVSHAWPAVAERCGLSGVTFHDLRHACGSLLLWAGWSLPVVSAVMGHANTQVTATVYAHVIGRIPDDVFARSDAALGVARRAQ